MKQHNILFLIIISMLGNSCSKDTVYLNPDVQTKYPNETIDSLLQAFDASRSKDIKPSPTLKERFNVDFPNAEDPDWEYATGVYEVEFEIKDTDYKAYYDEKFELIAYEYEIEEADLPALVTNGVIAKYPDYNMDDIDKITRGNETYYRLKLKRKKSKVTVYLDTDGKLVE